MGDVLNTIGEGLKQSFLMAYEVWWALVLGFAITTRPSRGDIFGSVQLDYKLALNSIALVVFAVLFNLSKQTRAAHAAESPETAASSSATRGS
jgi:hypothetical protein